MGKYGEQSHLLSLGWSVAAAALSLYALLSVSWATEEATDCRYGLWMKLCGTTLSALEDPSGHETAARWLASISTGAVIVYAILCVVTLTTTRYTYPYAVTQILMWLLGFVCHGVVLLLMGREYTGRTPPTDLDGAYWSWMVATIVLFLELLSAQVPRWINVCKGDGLDDPVIEFSVFTGDY